ncbi:MAG: hypothetical protein NC184_04050 [Roseburia sp.]|nr:hypothetical protein [Roseburia sp.]
MDNITYDSAAEVQSDVFNIANKANDLAATLLALSCIDYELANDEESLTANIRFIFRQLHRIADGISYDLYAISETWNTDKERAQNNHTTIDQSKSDESDTGVGQRTPDEAYNKLLEILNRWEKEDRNGAGGGTADAH